MFKMLLASTALTALVSTSAFAASHAEATDTNTAAEVTTETEMNTQTNDMDGMTAMHASGSLASDLIGSAVYGSANEDADMIGDVNDIVISPEGEVTAVIVGVGGFLGIGEKNVAVEYKTIEWADRDGERWLVANMSREQLEAAEAFDRSTIYDEARSTDESVEETRDMAARTDTDPMTASEETAERVEEGESAVEPAETRVMVIDREMMTPVQNNDLTAERLIGQTVYGANDDNIGEVDDVLLGSDNQIEGFIVDVGGFLGMGEKEVVISPEKLDIRADADGGITVFTPFTEEELEAQEPYSEDDWNADRKNVMRVTPEG